jgi:hypothetical protein
MPRRRNSCRWGCESKARSPRTAWGRRRGRPTLPAIGGMASTSGSSWVTSWRLAPVILTASGIPLAEVRT